MIGLLFELIGWMIKVTIAAMALILAAIVWVYKEIADAVHSRRLANDPAASPDASKLIAGGILAAIFALLLLVGSIVEGASDDGTGPDRRTITAERSPPEPEPYALLAAESRLEKAGYRTQRTQAPNTVAGLVINEGAMRVQIVEFVHSAAGLKQIAGIKALAKRQPFQAQAGQPDSSNRYTLLYATIEEPAKLPLNELLRITDKVGLDIVDDAKIEVSQSQAVRSEPEEPTQPAPPEPTPVEPSGGGGTPSYSSCDTAPPNVPVPLGSPLDADGDGIGCES